MTWRWILLLVSGRPMGQSWWTQLTGDPLSSVTALLAVATLLLGIAAFIQAFVTHRTRIDSASPRVAISLGNVGWPPVFEGNPLVVETRPYLRWVPVALDRDMPPTASSTRSWAVHTVGRIRNDGAASAYVQVQTSDDGAPIWSYRGEDDPTSPLFRVSTREFTLAPNEQVELDLYPSLPSERWGDPIRIVWKVTVQSRLPTTVVDRCELRWDVSNPTAGGSRRLAADPVRRAMVTRWTRHYHRWRIPA